MAQIYLLLHPIYVGSYRCTVYARCIHVRMRIHARARRTTAGGRSYRPPRARDDRRRYVRTGAEAAVCSVGIAVGCRERHRGALAMNIVAPLLAAVRLQLRQLNVEHSHDFGRRLRLGRYRVPRKCARIPFLCKAAEQNCFATPHGLARQTRYRAGSELRLQVLFTDAVLASDGPQSYTRNVMNLIR